MSDQKIYDKYISTHFGDVHPDLGLEYKVTHRIFRKQYRPHFVLSKEAYVVDLGCGMGHFLNALEIEGYHNYLGVDTSPENITFCKNKGFNVIESDFFDFLEKESRPIGAIILSDVIEHLDVSEGIRLVELIHKRLSVGGKLFISTPNLSNPTLGSSSRYDDISHKVGYTEVSLMQLLKVGGFKDLYIKGLDVYVFYENPLNYPAKILSKLVNFFFRLCFLLYGRRTTKIFDKHLLAVAKK